MRTVFAFLVLTIAAYAAPTIAAPPRSPEEVLAKSGIEPVRHVSFDLCWPADGIEYAALGKQGIVRLESTTALPAELPLAAVYVEAKGIAFPLRRLVQFPARQDDARTDQAEARYARQVSFYLLPLNLTKLKGQLTVDFKGQRTGFGVTSFPVSGTVPAFVRLDAYDTPSEPDGGAILEVLRREYPDDFPDQ